MRRDLAFAGLVALVLFGAMPAYDRVFADPAWRVPTLAAGALALLLAVLVRRAGRGPLLAATVSVVALLGTMPWLLELTDRPVVPGPVVLATLRELFGLGLILLEQEPSPAEPARGLVLLTAGGWWIIAHVAHELAVRWQRTGAALVPLTVLWSSALVIPVGDSRGWLQIVPYLGAAVLLLLAGVDHERETEEAPRVPAVGVGVGALAIVVGLTAPWVLPGYDQPGWVSFASSSNPRGYQPIVDVSNRLGQPEPRDVLRVRSSERTYLRLAGLDAFDGATWRLGPNGEGTYRPDPSSLYAADDVLPPEQPAAESEVVEVDIEVLELENIYVPLPYQPVEILGPIRSEMVWSTEGGFLATWDTVEATDSGSRIGIREGTEYRVRAARPAPSFEQLRDLEFDEDVIEANTTLPRGYPELGAKAREVYEEAGATTVVEQALALQEWFIGPEGGFTYDLDVPALRGEDALTDFVLEHRVGYCEYFATAMAVMLRETGIPARVAVGFLPGRVTQDADPERGEPLTEYTVSTSDAHAWVEVLFPGYGWITFEPTPRSDDSHIVPRQDDLAPTENEQQRRLREALERTDELDVDPFEGQAAETPGPDDAQMPDEAEAPDAPGTPAQSEGVGPGSLVLVVGAVFAVALVGFALARTARTRRLVRRRAASPRERVIQAQRDLLSSAHRIGVGRAPHETTPETLSRWQREGRIDASRAQVGPAVQAAAFGGELDEGLAAEVERTIDELEELLRASVPPRERALVPLRRSLQWLHRTARRAQRWWAGP